MRCRGGRPSAAGYNARGVRPQTSEDRRCGPCAGGSSGRRAWRSALTAGGDKPEVVLWDVDL